MDTYAHTRLFPYPVHTDGTYPLPVHDPRLVGTALQLTNSPHLLSQPTPNPDMAGSTLVLWCLPGSSTRDYFIGYAMYKFLCWYAVTRSDPNTGRYLPAKWQFTVQTLTHYLDQNPSYMAGAAVDMLLERILHAVAPPLAHATSTRGSHAVNYTGYKTKATQEHAVEHLTRYIEPARMVLHPLPLTPFEHFSHCRRNVAPDDAPILDWVHRELNRDVHPAVVLLLRKHDKRPADMSALVQAFPHVPQDGCVDKVAYTRSEQHGQQDRQTVTSLSKFVRQHFPFMLDHELRDFVAGFAAHGSCTILRDTADIIHAVQNGPPSCMQDDNWDGDDHPYSVYDPALGWGLAVRGDPAEPQARALVFEGKTVSGVQHKCFVRTYGKNLSSGSTQSDDALAGWLQSEGYALRSDWPEGTPLRAINCGGAEYVMPYLDGSRDCVREYSDNTLVISDEGAEASNTSGTLYLEELMQCDHCGDSMREDDSYGARSRHGESMSICYHCMENRFTSAWVNRHEQDYVHSDYITVTEGGDCVADFALDDGDTFYTRLDDGTVVHEDDAVCTWDGCRLHVDDALTLEAGPHKDEWAGSADTVTDYEGRCVLQSECVQCEVSREWVLKTEAVHIDGAWYRPDEVPEDDEPDDTDSEELVINDAQQTVSATQAA